MPRALSIFGVSPWNSLPLSVWRMDQVSLLFPFRASLSAVVISFRAWSRMEAICSLTCLEVVEVMRRV